MKKLLVFLFAITMGFIPFSCNKESVELSEETHDLSQALVYGREGSTIDLSNYSNEISEIWATAYNVYGMEALCSCDCARVKAIKGVFDNYHSISEYLEGGYWDQYDCGEMMQIFSNDCNYSNQEDYISFVKRTFELNNAYLTEEEKLLITDLLNDVKVENYNIVNYRNRWYGLEEKSSIDNLYSMVIIETFASVRDFVIQSDDFDEPGQAIFAHLAGAIAGAGINLYVEAMSGVIMGEPGIDDVGGTLIKGAIGGAIAAV